MFQKWIKERKHDPLRELEGFEVRHVAAHTLSALPSGIAGSREWCADLYTALLDTIDSDDVEGLKVEINAAESNGMTLCNADLRDPHTSATILHYALTNQKRGTAEYLISHQSVDLLLQEYDVTVEGQLSKKTCLHLLTENGWLELMEALMARLGEKKIDKKKFAEKRVLFTTKGMQASPACVLDIAAFSGNTEMVKAFIKRGLDPNITNNKNDTPLMWAVRGGKLDTVRELIKLKAKVNKENDEGATPLYCAVRYCYEDILPVLLKEGKANVHHQRKQGLMSPLVLAAAMGYFDVVRILLDHGAKASTRIAGGEQALHHAAANGHCDIITILIEMGADVNALDDLENSPLMHAVKSKEKNAMIALVNFGADMDCRNKLCETIWDYAVEADSNDLLQDILKVYRQVKCMSDTKLFFPIGKTPLHIAAQMGDSEKISIILKMGADPESKDENGNTFFHIAARLNHVEIVERFIDEVKTKAKNYDGDTAIHLACQNGDMQEITLLMESSNLEVRNKQQETALHVAAKSHKTPAAVVSHIVNAAVKDNNWSVVDAKDVNGNTALHLAAISGRNEIMEALRHLNPTLLNEEGESPLHTAAKTSYRDVLRTMLQVFNVHGKGVDIDQQNTQGESLLHICAEHGNPQMVEELIRQGADLSLKDTDGNTVLHALVLKTMTDPSNRHELLNIFYVIVKMAPTWWCLSKRYNLADDYSELCTMYRRDAVLYLASDTTNKMGLNLICYATKLGAKDFLEILLSLPEIFCCREGKHYRFNVSHLIPETTPQEDDTHHHEDVHLNEAYDGNTGEKDDEEGHCCKSSSLDYVAKLEDEVLASQLLDIVPLRYLVQNYWKAYQWIYGLLMTIHVIYMICYSAYGIPLLSETFQSKNGTVVEPSAYPWVFFLTWPMVIFTFEICYITADVLHHFHHRRSRKSQSLCRRMFGMVFDVLYIIYDFLKGSFSHIASLAFAFLVLCWFILYMTINLNVVYFLSSALIIGWLFTISFTKGFQTVHAFSIMLKYIIIRDIARFLFIYLFVLLAFTFGLHALFQTVPALRDMYDSPFETMFLTFNIMLGMDEFFHDDFDNDHRQEGRSSTYGKLVYLIYVIFSTIILLNILIAMMSDTYNRITSQEGTTWRISSVRLAVKLEHSLSCIPMLFRSLGIIKSRVEVDEKTGRYTICLTHEEVSDTDEKELDEVLKLMYKLESSIEKLEASFIDLSTKVHENVENRAIFPF